MSVLDSEPCLGIDFGGVIIPMLNRNRKEDTQLSDRFLSMPPQPEALERIRDLVGAFEGNVWIVSKAGDRTEALTRQWLLDRKFFAFTGMLDHHLRFCRERTDKKPLCLELGITHFIDDRLHVMQILKDTVRYLYLFGGKVQNRGARKWTTLVENWTEAFEAIVGDLQKLVE